MSREHRKSNGSAHRLVQFTDPHIGSRPDYQLLGLDTGRTLDEVLRAIECEQPQAEMQVATGDISANGSQASYQRFLQKMQRVKTPWYWLPGNHDEPARMRRAAPARSAEMIALGHWRLLLLDTSLENEICGGLSESQLQRLQQLLHECRDHPVMVLMHHQPVPVGSDWIDGHMLREGGERLLQLVTGAPGIKALVWGHVHQQFDSRLQRPGLEDLGLHATPSTSVQFTPGSGPFSVDDRLPGYRWFDLRDDGSYSTGVERVSVSEYSVDLASGGY
ncbi:metallophosphoesterase [Microbulbifer halophilus]|uniref:Metallophosphoesterase n=1 Tax=Microbulbifer halophilus TaxID=453963 RepID=A0ABW5E752_9GAMM|nr:metallophosphoesterase [Microbulbifer halophilus]MCW8126816.1 metallophosphoesterase [Microbulbifer halophilus]